MLKFSHLLPVAFAMALTSGTAQAGQPFETESARLPEKGHGNVQIVAEYLTSSEEKANAFPVVLEYGVTDRLRLKIEPTLFASVRPKGAAHGNGFGVTEVILTYLVAEENGGRPALALAGELVIPTNKNPLLGSGSTDFRIFGILSKQVGNVDIHSNVGFTKAGRFQGTKNPNAIDYSLAAEVKLHPKWSLTTEVTGETLTGGGPVTPTTVGETSGTTITGMIGFIHRPSKHFEWALATTYDTNSAFLIKTGFTFRF